MRCGAPVGSVSRYFIMVSTTSLVALLELMACWLPSSISNPSGCTMTSTLGEWDSSRNSMGLNLICAGPRRAKTCTSVAWLSARP
ncbi:Uncharacterised protein [Mycobacteroides abscessus subsp. massiliense]|nr:Uncharacterised protein [Mycobacteroides abscessus subsp. massiliense]